MLVASLGLLFLAAVALAAYRRHGSPTLVDVLGERVSREPAGDGGLVRMLRIDVEVADGRDEVERLDAAIRATAPAP